MKGFNDLIRYTGSLVALVPSGGPARRGLSASQKQVCAGSGLARALFLAFKPPQRGEINVGCVKTPWFAVLWYGNLKCLRLGQMESVPPGAALDVTGRFWA